MAVPSNAECFLGLPPLELASKGCKQAIEEDMTQVQASQCLRSGGFSFVEADDWFSPSTHGQEGIEEPSFMSNAFPSLPQDEFFKVVPTTLYMTLPAEGQAPLLGNDFLSFLDEEVDASIVKARIEKGWVSAFVFLAGCMCLIKARFYRGLGGEFILELQRRKGFAVAFNQIFQKLRTYYQNRKYVVIGAKEQNASGHSLRSAEIPLLPGSLGKGPPKPVGLGRVPAKPAGISRAPPKPAGLGGPKPLGPGGALLPEAMGLSGSHRLPPEISGGEMQHLFDQMNLMDVPALQVEAFNSMRSVISEQPKLVNEHDFVTNIKLFLLDGFPSDPEAEYALADLIVKAMSCAEVAQGNLAAANVLPLLVKKAHQTTAKPLIRKKLAEAVRQAVKNLKEHCTLGEKEAMIADLKMRLQESKGISNNKVKKLLLEAQALLSQT